MEKVVKCKKCDLYFGHSEKNTKCPFCKIEYVEVGEKDKDKKDTDKKGIARTRKKSFKIWGKN